MSHEIVVVPIFNTEDRWTVVYHKPLKDYPADIAMQGRSRVQRGQGHRKIKRAQTYKIIDEREEFFANEIPNTNFKVFKE